MPSAKRPHMAPGGAHGGRGGPNHGGHGGPQQMWGGGGYNGGGGGQRYEPYRDDRGGRGDLNGSLASIPRFTERTRTSSHQTRTSSHR